MNESAPHARIPIAPAGEEVGLYEIRRKIYPRYVHGWFAKWRWALIFLTQAVFYGLPWLPWNGRQSVLFDLGARTFYVFGIVFWPQDVIYLAILLILAALSLFLFTAIAGRLWCGYACPQTVYTEIFLWIERRIEGDRSARMRLDGAPMSFRKLGRKAGKHGAWLAIALWTGYTFVGYFTPIRDLGLRVSLGQIGGWETFWILFYGFATYGNAG
ncbi:MAG: 4Fe-4S binding protein, partial [Hyphomicrobiales bacterium]